MAILKVNPTRMVLLSLKKRVKSAKRGHKLLKDKQDGLMQKFMEIIRTGKSMRKEVEQKLSQAFSFFLSASSLMSETAIENALMYPKASISLNVSTKNIMSVHIPNFRLTKEGDIITYGMHETSAELDIALKAFSDVFPLLIELAETEKSAEALALELETTRRRVNALEYKIIPDLQETTKYITMKLAEAERGATVNVMIIKNKLEKDEK